MRRLHLVLITSFCLLSTSLKGQNVGIDTETPAAKLDVVSSTSGILIPRLALTGTTDITTVPAATTSEIVYNTATVTDVTPGFYYWNGTIWQRLIDVPGEPDADWFETGDLPPNDINDDIFTHGNVGLGTETPLHKMDIAGNIRVGNDTIFGGTRPDQNLNIITNGGIQFMMDNDNGGSERFGILHNGVNSNYIFNVDENGNIEADGDLILETGGGNIIEMQGSTPEIRSVISSDDLLRISGTGGMRIQLDTDGDNAASAFTIQKQVDPATSVNLLTLTENNVMTLFPIGTGTGQTGGLKLRELDATGSNWARLRAPDAIGSNYTLTLPTTDGNANQVLQSDGSGNLSWVDGSVASVTAGVAITNSGTAADPILDVTTDNSTIDAMGPGGTLQVIDLIPNDGDYIWNQNALEQPTGRFWIEGDGAVSDFNITGGDIYGPGINFGASNSILRIHTQTDVRVSLDNDVNGNESFQIHKDGDQSAAGRVFEVFESGIVQTVGSYGLLESGGTPTYFTRLQSGDLTGSDLTFTLPINAGTVDYVLRTDGSGVLSWQDPNSLINGYWTRDATNGELYPTTIADEVGIGTADPAYDLEVDGSVGIKDYLYHGGDNNTFLRYTPDRLRVQAGGREYIDIQHSSFEVAINEPGNATDFRVEGLGDAHLLFTDGSAAMVGVGTSSPSSKLDVVSSNSGILIPRLALTGTTDVITVPAATTSEIVYNTASVSDVTPGFYYWDGAPLVMKWIRFKVGLEGEDHDWHAQDDNGQADDINENIYTHGNVGIGVNTPGAPLEVQANGTGNSFANGIYVYNSNAEASNRDAIVTTRVQQHDDPSDEGGDAFFVVDAIMDGGWSFGMDNDHENRFKFSNDPFDLSTATRMTIEAAGNVGIGTADPAEKLHVAGGWIQADNAVIGNGLNGDGTVEFRNGGWGRLGGTSGLGLWANGNADVDNSPAMLLLADGRIGLGTLNPRGQMEINSSASANVGNFTYYAGGGTNTPAWCCGGTVNNISLYAVGRVMAVEFDAHSDARIKDIKGISNSKVDLETLMGIEITNYTKVDKRASGDKEYKKVIAQQIETIYPRAVSFTREIVPDIYKMATIKNGWIKMQNDLKSGEKIKLIFPDDHDEIVDVIKADHNGFKVDVNFDTDVFVYGREVEDFRTVDYEAISMLNVSATQEQQRLIKALQAENQRLKSENESLQSKVSINEARLDAIESKLGIDLNADKE